MAAPDMLIWLLYGHIIVPKRPFVNRYLKIEKYPLQYGGRCLWCSSQRRLAADAGGKSGLHKTGWRLTAARGDPTIRATETSVLGYDETSNLHPQQPQIGSYMRGLGAGTGRGLDVRGDAERRLIASRDKIRLTEHLRFLFPPLEQGRDRFSWRLAALENLGSG